MGVRGGDEQAVAIERQISLDARLHFLRQRARVFPEQVSRGRLECLDVVAESEDEQDPVVNQRRDFIRSGGERQVHATRRSRAFVRLICLSGLKPGSS